MNSDAENFHQLVHNSLHDGSFLKAVLSKPAQKSADLPTRIDVRPVMLKQQLKFQFTCRTGTQETHANFAADEAAEELRKSAGAIFRDVLLQTATEEWMARYNRKGACSLKKTLRKSSDDNTPADHNRSRQYLIPDGKSCPFLIATGIMSTNGRVLAKHSRKFRQINRYVEFIRDIVDQLPAEGPIRVIDFGCGKSYLTFATHHFLTEILQRDVVITGLDRRPDVVATCNKIVQELNLQGIRFEEGDIAGYQSDQQVHLAISLHACDTATDDALASAVAWQANVIFAVPCCQHELAATLAKDRQPLFSNHGILHEKFASLATDAIRASLLSAVGYDTQVMEFIDMEHTAKNLLIRAVRRQNPITPQDLQENSTQRLGFSQQLAVPSLRLQQKLEEFGLLTALESDLVGT